MQGWRQFEGHIPAGERSDLVAAYHKRLTSADTAVRDAAVSLPYFDMSSCKLMNLHPALETAIFLKVFLLFIHKSCSDPYFLL